MSNPKAGKCRRLALVEPDQDKARLLYKIAEISSCKCSCMEIQVSGAMNESAISASGP